MRVENIKLKDIESRGGGFIREKAVFKNRIYEIIEGRLFINKECSAMALIKESGRNAGELIYVEDAEGVREEIEKLEKIIRATAIAKKKTKLIYLLTSAIIFAMMIIPGIVLLRAGRLTVATVVAVATSLTLMNLILFRIYRTTERSN